MSESVYVSMDWRKLLSAWIVEAEACNDFERACKMRSTYNALHQHERGLN